MVRPSCIWKAVARADVLLGAGRLGFVGRVVHEHFDVGGQRGGIGRGEGRRRAPLSRSLRARSTSPGSAEAMVTVWRRLSKTTTVESPSSRASGWCSGHLSTLVVK